MKRDPAIGRALREWLASGEGDGSNRGAPDLLAARVVESGAVEESIRIAGDHAGQAMEALLPFPEGPFRDALADLCRFTASRTH